MNNGSVRSMLVEIEGGRILLPSALIAEVLNYREADAPRDNPRWLKGMLRWRGEEIPMIELDKVLDSSGDSEVEFARMLVLYGIYHPTVLSFYALPIREMPHVLNATPEILLNPKPVKRAGVAASVSIEERSTWLPDFEYLEKLFQEAF